MNLDLSKYQYHPCDPDLWNGRETPANLGPQYWYQVAQCVNANNATLENQNADTIAIIGYACEEGVRRNQGRVGAQKGPDTIRKKLARLAYHHLPMKVCDLGNLTCNKEDLENCQAGLSHLVAYALSQSMFPIVLGGGHDIGYGHYLGISKFLDAKPDNKVGIINFDAHFDLRPKVNGANSGTPFYQILTENPENTKYLAIGIQKASNTQELFDIANKLEVKYLLNTDCEKDQSETTAAEIKNFISTVDHIYITIDLDGFSSAYAPGVSAPSPFGLTPNFVSKALKSIFESNKVISCDIAELNPEYDVDNTTANLAARLVDTIASNYSKNS